MRSALYLAIESDNFGVAEILANHGASVIADSGRLAKMLCQIGFDNDLKKLSFLVKCDCDIMQSDYDMRTVGHLAAAEGNIKMLEFLATSSAFDFTIKDRVCFPKMHVEQKQNENSTFLQMPRQCGNAFFCLLDFT